MKTGIELINDERQEQIEKHGITPQKDYDLNHSGQLPWAASCLAFDEIWDWDARHEAPVDWDLELWQKMHDKPHKERLIIAGALIAAELDRLALAEKEEKANTPEPLYKQEPKALIIDDVVFNEAEKYKQTLENLQQDEKGEYYFGKEKVSEMELCNHVGSVTRDGRGEYCKKCGEIW
jgi:hypothetical protein